ncbi:hypothetical protein EDD27_3884 [Nonomuraea polychroma]|uniref:Uncharacterized protein n=1 Tax=Nonomuraea polychroma TaxID=46176 RepID=A0A438M6N6_9ACTN|nr:hypothetical protein [Nonomuraea polychroma]RVX41362.1 hypothetical protein EDD27_3884 [Nonomuraea polychroma]
MFTPEDLGRVRIAPRPDPMWEMVLSLHLLQARGGGTAMAAWRRQVRDTKVSKPWSRLRADGSAFEGRHRPPHGGIARGRQQHQHNHDLLFRGVLAGSALVGHLESIRYLAPDVAIVYGTASA